MDSKTLKEQVGTSIVNMFAAYLSLLNAEDRLDALSQVTAKYCRECGNEQPNGFDLRCQCWNDE
jgi:hypothetical protein